MSYVGTSATQRYAHIAIEASAKVAIAATDLYWAPGEVMEISREWNYTRLTVEGTRSFENTADYAGMKEPTYSVDFKMTNGRPFYLATGVDNVTGAYDAYTHEITGEGATLPYHRVEVLDLVDGNSDFVKGCWVESLSVESAQNDIVNCTMSGQGLDIANATQNTLIPPDDSRNEGTVEAQVDGATNTDTSFISALADFVTTGVTTDDVLIITSGADAGSHVIVTITDLNTLVLGSALSATATGIEFYIATPVVLNGEVFRFQHGAVGLYDSTDKSLDGIIHDWKLEINNTITRGPAYGNQTAEYFTLQKREMILSITIDLDSVTRPIIRDLLENPPTNGFEVVLTLIRGAGTDQMILHFPNLKVINHPLDFSDSIRTTIECLVSNPDPSATPTPIGTVPSTATETAWGMLIVDTIPDYTEHTTGGT